MAPRLATQQSKGLPSNPTITWDAYCDCLLARQGLMGTVPDWVTALGTFAAFAVALRLLAKELAARREQEEDRRRAQATW